ASARPREAAGTGPVTLDFTGGLGEGDINLRELARSVAVQPETNPPDDVGAHEHISLRELPNIHERVEWSIPVFAGVRQKIDDMGIRALPNIRERIEWTNPDFAGVSQKLDDMVVIVGAGEIGPVGSSRTRFEVEMTGDLSAAGVIELAWTTGLIAWDDAAGAWFDADGEEIAEEDIYDRFHDEVLANVGVRQYHDDYGPNMPLVDNLAPELTTIYLERDMTFAVPDEDTARTFVADVEGATAHFDGEEWQVTRPAGSEVRVPRRVAMTRFVGGQIP